MKGQGQAEVTFSRKCALHLCSMWLKHSSARDLAWLSRESELCSNIYRIDESGHAAYHPLPGSMPWYVLLCLGSYSKKHIFGSRSAPNFKGIYGEAVQTSAKLKWAWRFRNEAAGRSKLPKLNIQRPTRPFQRGSSSEERPPIQLDWANSEIVKFAFDIHKFAVSNSLRLNPRRPVFLKLTRDWLRRNNLCVGLSDKDGVMVVLPQDVRHQMILAQFKPKWYKSCFPINMHSYTSSLHKWCTLLTSFISSKVVADCRYCINNGVQTRRSSSQVGFTVKTHKDILSVRLLHNSRFHMAEGLSAWVHATLSETLRSYDHICVSSRHLIKLLRTKTCSPRSCLLKVDIQDFYMDGDHSLLVQSCRKLITLHLSKGGTLPFVKDDSSFDVKVFSEILCDLLHQQFVEYQGYLYQVRKGSGMGSKHSSTVSSFNFLVLAELLFLEQQSHQIELYTTDRHEKVPYVC